MLYKYHKDERRMMNDGIGKMHERQIIDSATLHRLSANIQARDEFGQGEDPDCPKCIQRMLQGIQDQAGKEQYLNAYFRATELASECVVRYRAIVNGDPIPSESLLCGAEIGD